MPTPEPRFVLTRIGLRDRYESLEWELQPSGAPVTWAEADASAVARGGRLPSIAELVSFLGSLPSEVGWTLGSRAVFWSASGSPFARASQVRAVCIERPGRFLVVLLDKSERAQGWAVRATTPPALG